MSVVERLWVLPMVVGTVLAIDEAVDGDETVGRFGPKGVGPTSLPGDNAIIGLTPRLPISVDPMGIPVRAAPPGVVGNVDVGVEEDETILLEPEPHMPEVSGIPELVDSAHVADIPDDEVIPDGIDVPDVAAVAGVVVPIPIPPPSLAVGRNVPVGEVPKVSHVVPVSGTEVVPVTWVGAGLMPGDAISVEPRGMPVGGTVEPVPMPSGEVTPSGAAAGLIATWANTEPEPRQIHAMVAIKKRLMCSLLRGFPHLGDSRLFVTTRARAEW